MLDTYRRLEANGVIGRMQKVDKRGQPIIDPSGEIPGDLIVRPFAEFPKRIARSRMVTEEYKDKDGVLCQREVIKTIETIVNSKREELQLIAENPSDDIPISPLERERNELAQLNAEKDKALAAMEDRIGAMMAQMASLAAKIDGVPLAAPEAPPVRVHNGEVMLDESRPTGRGIEALALGKK